MSKNYVAMQKEELFWQVLPSLDACALSLPDQFTLNNESNAADQSKSFHRVLTASRERFGPALPITNITCASQTSQRPTFDVCSVLNCATPAKVIAPMVKYSRAEFRHLCRTYGCQIGVTPMVITEDMAKTNNWTRSDLFSVKNETALLVQLASNNAVELAKCCENVYWGCDGVDINLGCPQKFAFKRCFGSALLENFDLVADLINTVRRTLPPSSNSEGGGKPFSLSIKIRILPNLRKTIDLCQKAEHAGISFITVHGRYPYQKDQSVYPANWDAIRTVCDAVKCPVIANGDVHTLHDYKTISSATQCSGVMSATGLLNNPALYYAADESAPLESVLRWFSYFRHDAVAAEGAAAGDDSCSTSSSSENISWPGNEAFLTFHNHLIRMLPSYDSKREKSIFSLLTNRNQIAHFLLHEWHRADEFSALVSGILDGSTTTTTANGASADR